MQRLNYVGLDSYLQDSGHSDDDAADPVAEVAAHLGPAVAGGDRPYYPAATAHRDDNGLAINRGRMLLVGQGGGGTAGFEHRPMCQHEAHEAGLLAACALRNRARSAVASAQCGNNRR